MLVLFKRAAQPCEVQRIHTILMSREERIGLISADDVVLFVGAVQIRLRTESYFIVRPCKLVTIPAAGE